MPRNRSKSTEDGWAKLIREELTSGCVGRPQGEGWKTCAEFAEERGCSIGHAHATLRSLEARGRLEKVRGRVSNRWLVFYRPKP